MAKDPLERLREDMRQDYESRLLLQQWRDKVERRLDALERPIESTQVRLARIKNIPATIAQIAVVLTAITALVVALMNRVKINT